MHSHNPFSQVVSRKYSKYPEIKLIKENARNMYLAYQNRRCNNLRNQLIK